MPAWHRDHHDEHGIGLKRETAIIFAENPFALGSPEFDRFLYDTISAKYDHLWVDPRKRTGLDCEYYELVHALKKPPSLVELIDIDPTDYFGVSDRITTYLHTDM